MCHFFLFHIIFSFLGIYHCKKHVSRHYFTFFFFLTFVVNLNFRPSKLRGLAIKACFAKQSRDSSNSELCVKSTGLGDCCFETLTAVRVCGLVK